MIKINADTYLKGPVKIKDIQKVLCYSSKITGLVVNKINFSEVSEKVLNLGLNINKNYVPVEVRSGRVSIKPPTHLGYSPSSGFDTLIFYAQLDEFRDPFPVGYSKLNQIIGNSELNSVESLTYGEISIRLFNTGGADEYLSGIVDIGDVNTDISNSLKEYLSDFKKKEELINSKVDVESPISIINDCLYQGLPSEMLSNQTIPNSDRHYWESGVKVPLWIGADNIRVLTDYSGNEDKFMSIYPQRPGFIFVKNPFSSIYSGNSIDVGYDIEKEFRYSKIPKFMTGEFVIDENGAIWSYPYLGRPNEYTNTEGKTLKLMSLFLLGDEVVQLEETEYKFPCNIENIYQQPLLDLTKGVLVSEESIFDNNLKAQNRVRDIVNTIIPLTLLFSNSGKIWIKLKIGAWFVFDVPQYDIEILQNRTTAIVVPKLEGCIYYPINDKSMLVRTPQELKLYNAPGEWCDDYTMNTVVLRYPQSKLLKRFTVGGSTIDENNIFDGPLKRYRKNILPKGRINIIAALNGIIVYYQELEDNKLRISYL